MLRYYVKRSFAEDLQELKTAPLEHAWVYGMSLTDKEINQVVEDYDLDGNIIRDIHDKHELPRVEYSGGILYVFTRIPHQSTHGAVTSFPLLSILKGSLLITLSTKEYFTPADVFGTAKLSMKSNKHVFTQLLTYITSQYGEQVHRTGTYISNTKKRLNTREVGNKDFIYFVTVESDLNEFQTNLSAMLAVLQRLHENRHDTFSDSDCELIEDIILYVNQLLVTVNSHMQTLVSIRNAYTTISNNTLNHRMKTLTLLTVLITLPNVFYGMFGMNVALPFADQPWAYGAITGFSVLVVLLAYSIVHRFKF